MADKKEIRCLSCGGTITIEGGMTEGFCLHCGERFQVAGKADSSEPPLTDHAIDLFEKEDWSALAAYVTQGSTPDLALLRETARVHILYAEYAKDAEELARVEGPKGLLRFVTGRNAYGENPIHRAFYDDVQARVADIARIMEESGIGDDLRQRAAQNLAGLLLGADKNTGTPMYWSLVAVEQSVMPIIPFLSLAALVERYEAYRKANPDNQSLPNQLKVKKAMEQSIADKGGQVSKRKFFGRK